MSEPELRALGHDVVAPDLPIDDPAAGLTAPLVVEKVSARLLGYLDQDS